MKKEIILLIEQLRRILMICICLLQIRYGCCLLTPLFSGILISRWAFPRTTLAGKCMLTAGAGDASHEVQTLAVQAIGYNTH